MEFWRSWFLSNDFPFEDITIGHNGPKDCYLSISLEIKIYFVLGEVESKGFIRYRKFGLKLFVTTKSVYSA